MSDAIEFECPECKRPCRVSIAQKAVQHSDPVCKTWVAHKGDRDGKRMQDFLGLALMAKGAAAVDLSHVGNQEKPRFTEREKSDVVEQLHEGLKKL